MSYLRTASWEGIVGTTVAPWRLFFQRSNVIDKRLTPRWMRYERMDAFVGEIVVVVGAAALMIARPAPSLGRRVGC